MSCCLLYNKTIESLDGYLDRECAVCDVFAPSRYYQLLPSKKRADIRKAIGRGFEARFCYPVDHYEEMLEINRSKDERCGRPIDDSYWNYPRQTSYNDNGCGKHRREFYGVFREKMVGYISIIVLDHTAIWSMFLGHGDYLTHGIMPFLHYYCYQRMWEKGITQILYGKMAHGGPNMKKWKERMLFKPKVLEIV